MPLTAEPSLQSGSHLLAVAFSYGRDEEIMAAYMVSPCKEGSAFVLQSPSDAVTLGLGVQHLDGGEARTSDPSSVLTPVSSHLPSIGEYSICGPGPTRLRGLNLQGSFLSLSLDLRKQLSHL